MPYQNDKEIIGKTITRYELGDGGYELTLFTSSGKLSFSAYGDCCSETWIENVTAPKFPATILEITSQDLGTEQPGTRQEYDQLYSITFKTTQGDLQVEFRNSSNGYYGGALEYCGYTSTTNLKKEKV
jgi:hypothetical protein